MGGFCCWALASLRSLAVGFAAVFYGEDQDGVSEIVEADAVVAHAETELGRVDVLESLDIAFAGGKVTSHDMQDAARGGLVDSGRSALAGSVQAIFFPIVTGPCCEGQAGCGPCARNLRG